MNQYVMDVMRGYRVSRDRQRLHTENIMPLTALRYGMPNEKRNGKTHRMADVNRERVCTVISS